MKFPSFSPAFTAIKTFQKCAALLVLTSIAGPIIHSSAAAPSTSDGGVTRFFILSGQSNMAGLDPDETFIPTLKEAFPEDQIVVVKDAENGQPLRRWFAREEPRDLYKRLFETVKASLQDTVFTSVTFIWMQGEADASWAEDSGRYETHMKGLIEQLRHDLDRKDMTVVMGRISDHFSGTEHGDKVRQVQLALAESDPMVEWIDTDDLARRPDDVHYTKEGSHALGERFARKAVELIQSQSAGLP